MEHRCVTGPGGRVLCLGGFRQTTANQTVGPIVELDHDAQVLVTKQAVMPLTSAFGCALAANGRIYCFGGTNTVPANNGYVQEYDPAGDVVSRKMARVPGTNLTCTGATNGRMYCFGASAIFEYDPAADQVVEKLATVPAHVGSGRACFGLANGLVDCVLDLPSMLTGGRLAVFEYDPVNDAGQLRRAVHAAGREPLSCALAGTTITCFDGGARQDIVDYDTVLDRFTERPVRFPQGLVRSPCAFAANGRAYCLGGGIVTPGTTQQRSSPFVLEYTPPCAAPLGPDLCEPGGPPGDRAFVSRALLPQQRVYQDCAAVPGGRVYCLGGARPGGSSNDPAPPIAELDHAAGRMISKMATLPLRTAHACAGAANGRIYCFGGYERTNINFAVYEYDPVMDVVAQKAARFNLQDGSCTGVPNGRVYCFGPSSIFEYDPSGDMVAEKLTTVPAHVNPGRWCAALPAGTIRCVLVQMSMLSGRRYVVWDYDPAADTGAMRMGTYAVSNSNLSCTMASSGRITCFTGAGTTDIVSYDPVAAAFTQSASRLPLPLVSPECEYAPDGRAYCFGGYNFGTAFFEQAYAYVPGCGP